MGVYNHLDFPRSFCLCLSVCLSLCLCLFLSSSLSLSLSLSLSQSDQIHRQEATIQSLRTQLLKQQAVLEAHHQSQLRADYQAVQAENRHLNEAVKSQANQIASLQASQKKMTEVRKRCFVVLILTVLRELDHSATSMVRKFHRRNFYWNMSFKECKKKYFIPDRKFHGAIQHIAWWGNLVRVLIWQFGAKLPN